MRLPQCELALTTAQEILFVSGGRLPSRQFFLSIAGGRKIFCIDKGIDLCKACGVVPNFLIGDFDSANQSAVSWARDKGVPVESYPADKDLTDTQLTLRRAAELYGDHTAILTGAFGGRVDHLYSTIHTCAALNRAIVLADEREIIFYVKGGEEATIKFFKTPLAVSLLSMTSACRGVTTNNLHWELDGATLAQDFPNATSNRIERDEIFISIEGGVLAVYLCFAE